MIRKSLRKSSFTFGDPRVSLHVTSLTANQYFWRSRVFLAVLRVFRGIMGCSGVFRGCSRVLRGCFGGVPGVFRVCSGVFRGVPGCSGFYSTRTKWQEIRIRAFMILVNLCLLMQGKISPTFQCWIGVVRYFTEHESDKRSCS